MSSSTFLEYIRLYTLYIDHLTALLPRISFEETDFTVFTDDTGIENEIESLGTYLDTPENAGSDGATNLGSTTTSPQNSEEESEESETSSH